MVAPAALVFIATGAFVSYDNWRVTGDPLLFPCRLHSFLAIGSPGNGQGPADPQPLRKFLPTAEGQERTAGVEPSWFEGDSSTQLGKQ